jgi:hypothetical protein
MSLRDALQSGDDERVGNKLILDMAEALVARGIEAEDLGRLARLKVNSSEWNSLTKDAEGEAHLHDLRGIKLSAEWFTEPEWPVIQAAQPIKFTPAKTRSANGAKVTCVLPDQQYGFRRIDGDLIPAHDRDAINAALAVCKAVKPDRIQNLGDLIDLPEFTLKFTITPEMHHTTQPALDEAHRDITRQLEICANVDVLEGNHDDRLAIAVTANAMAALRLRRANTPPDEWPVLSLPNLLRLDELGVTYHDGYPANRTKIADGNDEQTPLFAVHGESLDMMKLAKQSRQSYIQGHIHRRASYTETFEIDGRPTMVTALTPGCLCRIDGFVPSTKSAKTRKKPLTRWENWQQGMAVITEWDDGDWAAEIVPIHRGRALYRGKTYEAG